MKVILGRLASAWDGRIERGAKSGAASPGSPLQKNDPESSRRVLLLCDAKRGSGVARAYFRNGDQRVMAARRAGASAKVAAIGDVLTMSTKTKCQSP